MRRLMLTLTLALLAACGAAESTPTPTLSPTASPTALVQFPPLPPSLSGIPEPGDPSGPVAPRSLAGGWAIGVARTLDLGHCGLGSPLDFDGSLWDPIGGHDGRGGPITEEQSIDLINATTVAVTLVDPRSAWLVTPSGAVVLLARHSGPRGYRMCD